MIKKFLMPITIAAFFIVVLLLFRDKFFSFSGKLEDIKKSTDAALQDIKKEITNPPPLRILSEFQQALLTQSGVLKFTNIQRLDNGLLPLAENAELDSAATRKIKDMFNRQYFEHISPDGKNIGDLAEAVGYKYIAIGENLALGNFKDDQMLVRAWMDSPGHRANILNTRFREIGIAVGKGLFEGKSTWLAVQAFALPLASCPQAEEALKSQITWLESQIAEFKVRADNLLNEMGALKKSGDKEGYNRKVNEYNTLVGQINGLLAQVKDFVTKYNSQVQIFNACVVGS